MSSVHVDVDDDDSERNVGADWAGAAGARPGA